MALDLHSWSGRSCTARCVLRTAAWPLLLAAFLLAAQRSGPVLAAPREPLPDKLVVLTFDDSAQSHFTVVRPLLKQYGFNATFFITEGFDFRDNKRDYMTWEQIAQLHRDGFEIGNHSRDHQGLTAQSAPRYAQQLAAIDAACAEHGIPKPVSFAYPGNAISREGLAVLAQHGIRFARRGGAPEYTYEQGLGVAYEPGLDHPLLIPTAGDARPDWTRDDFIRAVQLARVGRVAVLQFHGVPDTAHAWVNTSPEKFQAMLHYLAEQKYKVIALRDLERYVDPSVAPQDPWGPIEDRKRRIAAALPLDDSRPPRDDPERNYWLNNMRAHGFTLPEMEAAAGLRRAQLETALAALPPPATIPAGAVRILPYPGGRHPRIGFRDGCIRPQRETKVSVFTPWQDGGYVVVDVPEAIWVKQPDVGRELLYLAHTHVPTRWDRRGERLAPLEWRRHDEGRLSIERTLPDQSAFGADVRVVEREVQMELWLRNGTSQPMTDLVVQNCVMLKDAVGFDAQSNDNKLLRSPFVACRDTSGRRWIITAWTRCVRPWANPPCPCLHSDPQFADCAPGETQRLRGWLTFYEGTEIDAEVERLRARWGL